MTVLLSRRPPVRPDTECEDCCWAEMTSRERIRETFRRTFLPRDPRETQLSVMQGIVQLQQAFMGTGPVGWYERHRALWVERGEVKELRRMQRHVTRDGTC